MNSFLIKIGKIVNAVKRDGFFATIARLSKAVGMNLRRVESGDVLFITGGAGVGASSRFRCVNQAEELSKHNFKTAFLTQSSRNLFDTADKFAVFILHRMVYDERLQKFMDILKKNKKTIIFETDDLLFDPQYLHQVDYLKNINEWEKKLYKNGLGSQILDDAAVAAAVTTTSFLATKLRKRKEKVFISTNKLSDEDLSFAQKIREEKRLKGDKTVVLGYFSGTPGHDKDLGTIAAVLSRLFDKYPHLYLSIAGPLVLSDELKAYEARIIRVPFTSSRKKHLENVASVDINIVPLENNDFCTAKSELKFFEAGILEVPTVAFANQTFCEAIRDGEDGFVAENETAWESKLAQLIESAELRNSIASKAYQTAYQRYTNQNSDNAEYYEFLRKCLN